MPYTSTFTPTFRAGGGGAPYGDVYAPLYGSEAPYGDVYTPLYGSEAPYGDVYTPLYGGGSAVRVTPDTAGAIAVANGAIASTGDGVVGPTITGTAGVASGAGSVGTARPHVVVRAVPAQATGRAAAADTWVLGAQRRLSAGTPRVIVRFRAAAVVVA